MKIKHLAFLIILLASSSIYSQSYTDDLAKGIDAFNRNEFSFAYEKLKIVLDNNNADGNSLSAASFYLAESLLNLNKIDDAVAEYEKFIEKYKYSGFRDIALYRLGVIYYSQKEFIKSREKLVILLNEFPNSNYIAPSNYFIGEAYCAEYRFREAEDFYKTAITLKESNPYIEETIFSLAGLYEKLSKYQQAITFYDQLLTYYRNSKFIPVTQFRIGVCYFQLKNYDNTILELSEAPIKRLGKEYQIDAQYYIASANYRLKEYATAKESYQNVIFSAPSGQLKRLALYGLAWTNFQSQDFQEAYKLFNDLAKTGTDTIAVNSYFWSGEAKRYSGDVKTAREISEDFIKKYPNNYLTSRAKFSLGSMDFNNGRPVDAESKLKAILATNDETTKAKAYTLLGEISLNKKEFTEAETNFRNALEENSITDDLKLRANLGLGITKFYLNKYDEALTNLQPLYSNAENFESNKVNFYLAETYFAANDYSKALKHYKLIKMVDDDLSRQALYGKAYACLDLKDYANASVFFKDYTTKYKKSDEYLDAYLRLADCYFGLKSFDKASAIYNDIIAKQNVDLDDDAAYYQYAKTLYMSDKKNKAIDELEAFKKKFPKSKYFDNAQYLIGWIHFQKTEYQSAISNYKKIYIINPNSSLKPVAYSGIGDCYYNLGNYDSAVVSYRKIFAEFPNTQYVFDAIRGIQDCYMMQDKPEYAIAEIDKFVASNPKSKYVDQALFKKGEVYYSSGSYESAIHDYMVFIHTYPKSFFIPNAYYWVGKSFLMLNNTDNAKSNFRIVTDGYLTSEVGIDAALELGNIYIKESSYKNAEAVYDKAITALPDSKRIPEVLFMKAGIYVKTNDMSRAYQAYTDLINYYDNSVFASKAKIELGLLDLANGRLDAAEQLFRSQAEGKVDDLSAKAQFYLGTVLFNQNKIDDAISAFVRVRNVFGMYDEWLTRSLLKLGDCYTKLNDKQRARQFFNEVLSRHKNDDFSTEANKKLKSL